MDRRAIVAVLSEVELFRGLDDRSLDRVVDLVEEMAIPPGQHVFFAGDLATEFYIVVSGRVRAYIPGHNDELAIGFVEPGQLFGEGAMLDGGPRVSSVVALEPTALLQVRRDRWLALIDQDVVIPRRVFSALGTSMRRYAEQAVDLLFIDVMIEDVPPAPPVSGER